jgi:WD40 repeat protein
MAFCSEARLVTGESDNVIRLWDLSSGKQIAQLLGHKGTISTMVWCRQTNQLISGSFDTNLCYWNLP